MTGIPKVTEMLKYDAHVTEDDNKPINRKMLIDDLARLVRVRADLATKALGENNIQAASVQIAFTQLYMGLIEQIRKGKYD